jgi:hypothetical protein
MNYSQVLVAALLTAELLTEIMDTKRPVEMQHLGTKVHKLQDTN